MSKAAKRKQKERQVAERLKQILANLSYQVNPQISNGSTGTSFVVITNKNGDTKDISILDNSTTVSNTSAYSG